MSTTREEMRRELKELTKLAETMRKESGPESRPPYAHLLEPENNLAPPTPDRPLSVSSVTVPPVVQPSVPPPATSDLDDYPSSRRGRKGFMAVAVGGALVVALVGGAAVGRSVTSHRAAANAAIPVSTGPVQGPLVVDPPQDPAAAQAPPAQPVADPPAPPAVAAVPAAANPSPATPPASPAAHRRPAGAAPHRAAKPAAVAKAAPAGDAPAAENDAPAPAKAAPVAKAAVVPLAAPAAAPAGGSNDSLEDMIRKAVASTPPKK